MTIYYTYYNQAAKKLYERATAFPRGMDNHFFYDNNSGRYLPRRCDVCVDIEGEKVLEFELVLGYNRCCGFREIGAIEFHSENQERRKKAVEELYSSDDFDDLRIGAFVYTRVFFEGAERHQKGHRFVELWPGKVTEGGRWYNPNSDNYCENMTLSFDKEPVVYKDDDEEDDNEDDED